MDEAVTCVVCCRVYQKDIRDPLVLPCGHTFCRSCITAVQNTSPGSLICPTCRGESGIDDITRLPICYPLVGLSSSYSGFKFGSCRKHGEEEQRFWCKKCELPLCSLCLYNDHKQGHSVQPIKTAMKDKRQLLGARLNRLRSEVMQGKDAIRDLHHYLTNKIKQVLRIEEQLDLLTDEVDDACCVEDILDCENKINAIDEESDMWLPKMNAMKMKTFKEENPKADIESKMFDMNLGNDAYGEDLISADEGAEASLFGFEESRRTRKMRLDFKEGRLLLHSIAHPAEGHLSIKVPSEVFLELGVDGMCLGRVYINLWCHLRRAKQFLALCVGTLGPSYVGSCFSHVAYQGKPKETLCCKEYWTDRRGPDTRELLADLEWGDEYSKEPQAGLLIPLSKFPDQHGFGICTRGNPGGTFHCPFGEVVAGMKVVMRAVEHHPVTGVTITHCGVVLPDGLSQ